MSSTNQPLKSSREGSRASGCDRHRRRATPRSRRTRRPAPTPRPPRRTTPYGTPPCRARGGALFLMSEVSMYASPAHSRRTTPCGPLPAPYTPHPTPRMKPTPCTPTSKPPKAYRGTSLTRKRTPLEPYRRPVPRVLEGSQGGGRFLMSEVPLCASPAHKDNALRYAPLRVE